MNECIENKSESCEACGHRSSNIICSTTPEILQILDQVKLKTTFKTQQIIYYQGNEPLGLFTISSGLVKLEITSEEGQTHTLRYVSAGSALGYQSLFSGENYQATAIAIEPTEVCFIPKATIMTIFTKFPQAALRLLQSLSKDLRQAEARWTDQMDKDASDRVGEALIFLQDHFTHQNWTRREIAEWAGTTPETVIRVLAQFEKSGFIDQSEGRNIKILNKEALIQKRGLRLRTPPPLNK